MLLNKEQVKLINERKVTHIKNFVLLERNYDFNLMSTLLEENAMNVMIKSNTGHLNSIYQIKGATNVLKEFRTFFDFLLKMFKFKSDSRDGVDLFFSLVTQTGVPHEDVEHVFIIGLKGKTIYRIYDKNNVDYEINKGDMIFIPRKIKHKVIGLNPRIIASIGFYDREA